MSLLDEVSLSRRLLFCLVSRVALLVDPKILVSLVTE